MTIAKSGSRKAYSSGEALRIDLLCQAIMSNHLHLLLRSRPDVVEEWNDNELAPSVADAVSGAAGSEASPAGAIGV